MTCPWLYILHETETSFLQGLVSWSRLVPPPGADRADSVIQTLRPFFSSWTLLFQPEFRDHPVYHIFC